MSNITNSFNFEFESEGSFKPLAARMRPTALENYVGQTHILAEGKPLRQAIENGDIHSLIFWGPPGTGKTTLAEIIATKIDADIERVSAVTSGIKDIRLAIENAKHRQIHQGRKTILFVDEVHRFNKSQQDAFLPFIEDGTILFIGATTENPAFELNNAVLSRTRVYVLKKLTESDLHGVLERALSDEINGFGQSSIRISGKAKDALVSFADGDARRLLNLIENCITTASTDDESIIIDEKRVTEIAGQRAMLFDKGGDAFYDLISAFHKSVRGSSVDGSLYWYCRILESGGDPLYVARRLLAIASEDIGNADPRALSIALDAWDTFQRVGPAEGERAIAQATVYLALAPKSNAVYTAFKQARALAIQTGNLEVPIHLRNSTSKITDELGHGESYRYAHDEEGAYAAGERYLPEELAAPNFYQPEPRGLEVKLRQKMDYLDNLDRRSQKKRYE